MTFRELPFLSRIYFVALVALGAVLAVASLWWPYDGLLTYEFLIFLLLGSVASRVPVKVPRVDSHFSMDSGFVFAIAMLHGLFPAVLAEILTKTILTLPQVQKETRYKVLFNVASGVVAIFAAGLAFQTVEGWVAVPAWAHSLSIPVLVVTYFLVNTFTIALIVALVAKTPVCRVWWKDFAWTALSFMACGSIATMLYQMNEDTRFVAVLMTAPIVGMAYFAHSLYLKLYETVAKAPRKSAEPEPPGSE